MVKQYSIYRKTVFNVFEYQFQWPFNEHNSLSAAEF